MDTDIIKHNAADLDAELNWLTEITETRLRTHEGRKTRRRDPSKIKPPSLKRSKSRYARFISERNFGVEERFVLALAIAPHIRPDLLDAFSDHLRHTSRPRNTDETKIRTGTESDSDSGDTDFLQTSVEPAAITPAISTFIPTGETGLFLLAGHDLQTRFALLKVWEPAHPFSREDILILGETLPGEPMIRGPLLISEMALRLFTTGEATVPKHLSGIPATRLTTDKEWDDLVAAGHIAVPLGQIETFLQNREDLSKMWSQNKHAQPGLNVLFHGPPGTGKTLTAALLGKKTGVDVYRIDLSAVVSRYIGETEKNLSKLFEKACNREWILFFDEADALFGKRTPVRDAHDRYSNGPDPAAASLFLQYLERHDGLSIVSISSKKDMDDHVLRRFHIRVHFPIPGADERLALWEEALGTSVKLERNADLKSIAATYELSGGTILNASRFALLHALQRRSKKVSRSDLLEGIMHHKP